MKNIFAIRLLLFVVGSFCFSNCSAWTTSRVFFKYPNTHFVETGSYLGDGIQAALDAGFPHVYSIELSQHYFNISTKRFINEPRVKIWLGDSSKILGNLIASINEPITFWLDGHYSCGNTAKGDNNTPLLQELELIKAHPINTHTILIDDVRLLGTDEFDFIARDLIIEKLMEINPNYIIKYEDGYIPNDVMVAYLL